MKQYEFDEVLHQMREDREKKTANLKKMASDLDVDIAAHGKLVHKMLQEYKDLKAQRAMLSREITKIVQEYYEKMRDFRQANEKDVTRNLEDVSEWALVNELAARGFTLDGGRLVSSDHDDEWLDHLNAKLILKNGEASESV